ncbi:hypothetical protein B0H19DRAFT_1233567, partial [Mycena capillaripes]
METHAAAMEGQPLPVIFAVRCRPKCGAEGGVGDKTHSLHLVCAPAIRRGRCGVAAAGVAVVWRMCPARRVVLAGGARGDDKRAPPMGNIIACAALRTQEVVKVVLGSTAGAGVGRRRQYTAEKSWCAERRRCDVGAEERQRCVLRGQLV